MSENINNEENKEINKNLQFCLNTFKEFVNDVTRSFPEYTLILNKNYSNYLKDNSEEIEDNLLRFFVKLKDNIIKISNKDESLFSADEPIELLEDIDFRVMWKNSNESNKEIIWKYLQTLLVLYEALKKENVVEEKDNKLFSQFNEALNKEDLSKESLDKLGDQAKAMFNIVENLSNNREKHDEIDEENGKAKEKTIEFDPSKMPGGSLFENSKIGEIAKELASEINFDSFAKDFENLNGKEDLEPSKLFDNLIGKDPSKLMSLIQDVGSKIQNKINSGNINEQDLVSEAQSMMQNLQGNPLFNNTANLFKNNPFLSGNDDNDMDDLDKDLNSDNMSDMFSKLPEMAKKMGANSKNMDSAMKMQNERSSRSTTRDRLKKKLEERKKKQSESLYK